MLTYLYPQPLTRSVSITRALSLINTRSLVRPVEALKYYQLLSHSQLPISALSFRHLSLFELRGGEALHGSLGMGLKVDEESAACVRLGFVMHYCAAVPLATGELSILSLLDAYWTMREHYLWTISVVIFAKLNS